jgi:hypothetical protein
MTREEERDLYEDRYQEWKAGMPDEFIDCFARLVAKGFIYDTGERRDGEILWGLTPGKEEEFKRWQEQLERSDAR